MRHLAILAPLLAVLLGATAAHAERGPKVPKDPNAKPCVHPAPADLSGTVTLDRGCIYGEPFVITRSNTTLDCNGAQLRDVVSDRAIRVIGEIDNVVVRDCYLDNSKGVMVSPPEREQGESDAELRARAPKNVRLERLAIFSSRSTGIFIGPHVEGVTVESCTVEQAMSAGIYLEYGTRRNVIRDNLLLRNGEMMPNGLPRVVWTRREGLAIDASEENIVEDNRFERNAFGGIFLYKNCWEYHTTKKKSVKRLQHARANVIRRNTFVGERIGVWVASRQARDLGSWDCGDPTPYPNPIKLGEAFPPGYPTFRSTFPYPYEFNPEYAFNPVDGEFQPTQRETVYIWPDFAEDNVIEDNRFEAIELAAVRIEDDRAIVRRNLFIGDYDYVFVGSPFRARYLKQPVLDARIVDNSFLVSALAGSGAPRDFAAMLALVPGEQQGTVVERNRRACLTPWGAVIAHGASVEAFEPKPPDAASCRSEQRACDDGALSGSFASETCVDAPPSAGGDSDGCQLGGSRAGLPAALLSLLALGLLLRRRR